MGQIERFPTPKTPPESLEELERRVHKLSQESKNVFLHIPHAQVRKKERKITTRQIFDVLRSGKGIDGPKLDQFGDWRIKLSRFTAGRTVQVVVVIKKDYLIVITVI